MSCKFSRRAASALLIAIFTLTCAVPAHARRGPGRHAFDGPAWALPEGGLFGLLIRLFECAGGGMDPNGEP